MATAAENNETAITQITARIVEVTASAQPDYSDQGRTISRGAYLEQLYRTRAALIEQRAALAGPWIVRQRGRAV